ncbi:hypothetical protein T03_16931 [Trichinella britovi]|uniref:Uncharacterized protein n=1 Tax=Trichinella britovi TaxID=45882 RepID=A0A0V1CD75_TRIBR|nr:hypothetical protein T03_16931 [Trichinella britovi]
MVWPHLESLKMIEISWIPIVLTTVMVTEEARTLLTQMEKATGKIFRGFWKIGEALKVILDETFPQLIATLTWVKVRCAALYLMDLHATVANSRNYKFTQSTPFFPFLIFRVEGIGSKPNDVSSSPLGHTVSRTFHFFGKTYHQKLILSSASGLLPVASNKMVRVHERGGGSSTPLSSPSNNRARSARNRNAFYGFFYEFA